MTYPLLAKLVETLKQNDQLLVEGTRLIQKIENGNKVVKVYYTAEDDEYVAKLFVDGEHHEDSDYYTDDKQDALSSGRSMVR